jgi:hypothetical protein
MQSLTKLVCPHCHAILKSTKPLRPGKQVSCLKCQAPFSVSPADLVAVTSAEGHAGDILVSATLAEDSDQPDLSVVENGAEDILGLDNPVEIPVGVLERPAPVTPPPYFPPPVPKATVQVAAPFAPPPSQNRGTWAAMIVGLLVFLACGAVLTWYCFLRNTDANELNAKPDVPGPEEFADSSKIPQAPDTPKEKEKIAVPTKIKPANFEEPAKSDPELSKPGLKKRPRKTLPPEAISFALPKDAQAKVDEAIKRGVKYLKAQQLASGTWMEGHHSVGYAALPGLTLLECQVPAKDLTVQKAAIHVRTHCDYLADTYDLSLAILFLDKLGERKDRGFIQQLALRLVAGQKTTGGWDYSCPLLTGPERNELMLFLHQTRPKYATLLYPLPKDSNPNLTDPLGKPGSERFPNPLPKDKNSGKAGKEKDSRLIPPDDAKPGDQSKTDPAKKTGVKPKVLPKGSLPKMKNPPVFGKKGKRPAFLGGREDNSNTQFALLALWAARRHDVPTENALTLAQKRLQTSQNSDGGWGYMNGYGSSDAMTGVGLLGLAVGHGASEKGIMTAVEARANKAAAVSLQDPIILKGLQKFGKYVGTPDANNQYPVMVNCYFLWTLERVGMIYHLRTIGNKDWYRWGVHILLPNQHANGSWFGGQYPGASLNLDTCFALLFLKRSNLVPDLTENLDLLLAITDPDAERPKKRQSER